MSLELYSFCFLRYIHDLLSAEFVNVGVVLWALQSGYLGYRFTSRFRRLSRFSTISSGTTTGSSFPASGLSSGA